MCLIKPLKKTLFVQSLKSTSDWLYILDQIRNSLEFGLIFNCCSPNKSGHPQ